MIEVGRTWDCNSKTRYLPKYWYEILLVLVWEAYSWIMFKRFRYILYTRRIFLNKSLCIHGPVYLPQMYHNICIDNSLYRGGVYLKITCGTRWRI